MSISKNIYELVVGTGILLISVAASVLASNFLTKLLFPKQEGYINILIVFIHVILIVAFTLIGRYILTKYITNSLILNSILALTGPLIGSTSLFINPVYGAFIKSI